MQPKHHFILYTFLSFALVIAVFLGLDYGLKAREASQVLEDGYTRRMLETQEHLQAISLKLSKAPIAGDARTQVELLTGVSRQADDIVSGLSALPLSHVAMSDTIKFCNQLSDYTLNLALSVAAGNTVGETDRTQLSQLESQCTLLLGQFVTARDAMLKESLRLSADPNVFYEAASLTSRPLEQVSDADNGMDYPSMIYDGAFSDARHYGEPKALGAERVDGEQALQLARAFVGTELVSEAVLSGEVQGVLESHVVVLTLTDGTVLNAEITKQGGQMLMLMPEHAAFEPVLSREECIALGTTFLRERGFGEAKADHCQAYDGMLVINFVPVQEGVPLYPDLVKVQVRMDTGAVVGFEANNYLMNHHQRVALTPTLTADEALARVSPLVTAETPRLCVIPYRDGERLAYEVPATRGEQAYRIYFDALTGEELEILLMMTTWEGEVSA